MDTFEALGMAWLISMIIPDGFSTIILQLLHPYSIDLHIPREGSTKTERRDSINWHIPREGSTKLSEGIL